MDPRPTAPTRQLDEESPQEQLRREAYPSAGDPLEGTPGRILEALVETGTARNEDLTRATAFEEGPEAWKQVLWRLHNEGYVKVRWVGLADPDPVEVRLTDRGRAWLAERAAASAREREAEGSRAGAVAPPA